MNRNCKCLLKFLTCDRLEIEKKKDDDDWRIRNRSTIIITDTFSRRIKSISTDSN